MSAKLERRYGGIKTPKFGDLEIVQVPNLGIQKRDEPMAHPNYILVKFSLLKIQFFFKHISQIFC